MVGLDNEELKMSWAIGYDENWKRDIGYGVPSICDEPTCNNEIDRGLAHVCGGDVYGGDNGCGLFFCGHHLWHGRKNYDPLCHRCLAGLKSFSPKPDTKEWITHKLTHPSWGQWRQDNPDEVIKLKREVEK